tara:strand:- start:320 stop:538 length:219 start_codon:yes stop_codon:yes gene_type:complete
MKEVFKVGLLTWFIIFLMIFFLTTFILWVGTSIWWLLTNIMIDRNMFMLITTTISLTLSIIAFIGSAFAKEK